MWTFKGLQGDPVNWYSEEEYKNIENKLEALRAYTKSQCEFYKTHQTEDKICDKCKDANCLLKDIMEIIGDINERN